MDSDIQHVSDCVFYDSELSALKKSFRDAYKILKDIDKRADRRQTVQISKSLFDYSEKRKDLAKMPNYFYSFNFLDYKIAIFRYQKKYHVLTNGFTWSSDYVSRCEWLFDGHLYLDFDTVQDCIKPFLDCVAYFVRSYLIDYFTDSECIPF